MKLTKLKIGIGYGVKVKCGMRNFEYQVHFYTPSCTFQAVYEPKPTFPNSQRLRPKKFIAMTIILVKLSFRRAKLR